MTAPLPRRKVNKIIELFFEGYSYNEISTYANAGKGSVEEVVNRLREGQYEEFQNVVEVVDTLREISVYVRKSFDGDLTRCHVGSVAWVCLNRMGIDPANVKAWAEMCEGLAPSDMTAKEFTKIAMWCWHVKEELDIDILELPRSIESLKATKEALTAEKTKIEQEREDARADVASIRKEFGLVKDVGALEIQRDELKKQVDATRTEVDSARRELGLLEDISGLQKTRHEEERKTAEAKGGTHAALAEARVTREGIETFRVFEGTIKAKGMPLDSDLFDTLLNLVASLHPKGIQDIVELKSVLEKEGMDAREGIHLLVGLWTRKFRLRQATAVANALQSRGSFSANLDRIMSLFDKYGTLDSAVTACSSRLDELKGKETKVRAELKGLIQSMVAADGERDRVQSKTKQLLAERETKIRAELKDLSQSVEATQSDLAKLNGQVKGEEEERDRIQVESKQLLAERETKISSLEATRLDAEEATRSANERAATALATQADAMAVTTALAKTRQEVADLRALIRNLGGHLALLVKKNRELVGPIQASAQVVALLQGHGTGIGFLVAAARTGDLETWLANKPQLMEEAAQWIQDELIKARGGALVSAKEYGKLREAKDREIESLNHKLSDVQRGAEDERLQSQTRFAEAEKKSEGERMSTSEALKVKGGEVSKLTNALASEKAKSHEKTAQLDRLSKVMPTVAGKSFVSVDEFHREVGAILTTDAKAIATVIYLKWQLKEITAGHLVVIRPRPFVTKCPAGHDVKIPVDAKYIAEVVSGSKSAGPLGLLGQPGIAFETCRACNRRLRITLDQLVS